MGELRDQMDGDLQLKGYRPVTRYNYLRCVRSFAAHYGRSPAVLGEAEVRAFLLHLIRQQHAKPATVRMYVAALKFLYAITLRRPEVVAHIPWPQVPEKLPDILTPAEIIQLFVAVRCLKHRVVLMLAYGAGLRISEVCSLQVSDIDSQRMVIHVRNGKGGKDRYVMLGARLLRLLREYWRLTQPQGSFLFPGSKGAPHMQPSTVQRMLQTVVAACGFSKRITPHTLRHCFATHLLEAGTDIRMIQQRLGHASIRTTVRYTQVSTRQIGQTRSPLDQLDFPPEPAPE